MDVLDLLGDPVAYKRWQDEVGPKEAGRQITEACREVMERDGVRAILPIAEKMDNLIAQFEEFTD